MKKILIVMLVTIVTTASAFANNNSPLNEKVLMSFNTTFSTAVNVTWKELKDYGLYHASFTNGQQQLDAFFNEEGELITTARTINQKQLPLAIAANISDRYGDMIMDADVLECNNAGITTYYVTVRSAKNTIILKADGDNSLSVFKKQKNLI